MGSGPTGSHEELILRCSGLDCSRTPRLVFEHEEVDASYINMEPWHLIGDGSNVDGLSESFSPKTNKKEPHSLYLDPPHTLPSYPDLTKYYGQYFTTTGSFGHEQCHGTSTNTQAKECPFNVSQTSNASQTHLAHILQTTRQTSLTSNARSLIHGVGFSYKENFSRYTPSFGGHKDIPATFVESIILVQNDCDKRISQGQHSYTSRIPQHSPIVLVQDDCDKRISQGQHSYASRMSQQQLSNYTSKVEPSWCNIQVTSDDTPDIEHSNFDTKSDTKVPASKLHVASQDLVESSYELFKTTSTQRATTLDSNRYFGALKGVELETLKNYEGSLLPTDKKWPFLLRFPVCCFGVNLGLGSQAILWKLLANPKSLPFVHAPHTINLVIWSIATFALMTTFAIYALKCAFYFEAVCREFNHPIRINFFFAPWISCMFLILGIPQTIGSAIHPHLWMLFLIIPIFVLDLKVYGEWLSGGEKHLSKIANPCTHLSLLGNFVGALLAATLGYKEVAVFFWSIGFIHYIVLLVTLYQRLPSITTLPKDLHPIFFLFIGLPNCASVAWAKISGTFDLVSRITYFVGIFLFLSLVARARLFWGFRFNIAWWAYTFPVTVSAIATIQYSLEVKNPLTQSLATFLSLSSSLIVASLSMVTILHTFVWGSMFPNDMAIAITEKGNRVKRKIEVIEGEH